MVLGADVQLSQWRSLAIVHQSQMKQKKSNEFVWGKTAVFFGGGLPPCPFLATSLVDCGWLQTTRVLRAPVSHASIRDNAAKCRRRQVLTSVRVLAITPESTASQVLYIHILPITEYSCNNCFLLHGRRKQCESGDQIERHRHEPKRTRRRGVGEGVNFFEFFIS